MGVEAAPVRPRVEGLYVRVSGSSGQETSLDAQEAELRATTTGSGLIVFKDRSSGLRESRPGLDRLFAAAREGRITVVRVTYEDRLARFGVGWLRELLARDGVSVEVLHVKGSAGGMDELLADFMSLVATFAGRMYGIRGREAKQRLLARAVQDASGSGR
jgi:predicted site-specific integrase-resolvase